MSRPWHYCAYRRVSMTVFRENPVSSVIGFIIALVIDYFFTGPFVSALLLGDALPEVHEMLKIFFWALIMAISTIATFFVIFTAIRKAADELQR